MKRKFTVSERLSFNVLFPEKSDMLANRISDDILAKIDLSKEEMEEVNLKVISTQKGSNYTWDDLLADKVNQKFEVDFTKAEVLFLKEKVSALNEKKEIPRSFSRACERMMDIKAEIPVDKTSENNKEKTPEEAFKDK